MGKRLTSAVALVGLAVLVLGTVGAGGARSTAGASARAVAIRVVVPGQPKVSPLVLMPLAHEAGGTEFHPGGKHFTSMDDPELKTIVAWINDVKN